MAPKRNTKTKKENGVPCIDNEVLSRPVVRRRGTEKVDKPIEIVKTVIAESSEPDASGAPKEEMHEKAEKSKSKLTKANKSQSNGDDVQSDKKTAKRGRKAIHVDKPILSEESKKKRESISVEKESEAVIEAKPKRGRKKDVAKIEEPVYIETVAAPLHEEPSKKKTKELARKEVDPVISGDEAETLEREPPKKKTKKELSKKEESVERTVSPSGEPPKERKARKVAEKKEPVKEAPVEKKRSRKAASQPEPKKVKESVEPKPKIAGRTRDLEKAAEQVVEEASDLDDAAVVEYKPAPRRKREAVKKEELSESEPKKKVTKPLQNKTATDYRNLDFDTCQSTSGGKMWNFKISSWNVDGIRAWVNKGGLEYINQEKPDIICLQEVKCAQDKLPEEVVSLPGYHPYWLCSDKDGYAGVGIYTKKMAIHVQYGLGDEDLDSEGRIITAEYEQFYLISTYVPNAGRKLVTLPKRLKWNDVFRQHVKDLNKKKPVIICGDMNVAHSEIDLTNPKTNKKNAGFTQEERDGMTQLLSDGFVDTFRHLHPEQRDAYTFWTYMMNCRAKNVGWRLDYIIVSERLVPALCDSVIRDQIYGSDHCPITLFLHLSGFEKLSL